MIASKLNSPLVEDYKNIHPRLKLALTSLQELVASNPADGRYEFDGNNVFANVTSSQTKSWADSSFEMHKEYLDIQFVLEGAEIIGMETEDKLEATTEYQPDYQLFKLNKEYDPMMVTAGEMLIIFPNEPHAPFMAVDDKPAPIRKIIVKVRY